MKRFLSILLCTVMVLSLLAGCGGGGDQPTDTTKHKHTYASEWSHDENNHWYAATCEHSTLQANFGEHLDDNLDGICDVCAYESQSCQHTYSEEWTSDATHHWHGATCNHIGSISEKGEHEDGNNDGACDTCGYMGDHTHTFGEDWHSDDAQHWHETTCGHDVQSDRADHVDMDNDGVCDVCAWFDASHTHTFSDSWVTDVTYHWHGATCEHLGAISGREQHADGDENGYCDTCNYLMCNHVDYDLDGECDICGGPIDPNHVHEFGNEIGSDVNGHWYVSTCHPGATSEKEAHVDSNNDGVCDVCAFQICGHSYDAVWTSNETHHWHAILCTCSIERKDYAPHVDEDLDGGCDVCMYGIPVEAVFEVILKDEPYTMVEEKMITYSAVVINFPQPGKYVITPSDEYVQVWLTNDNSFNNTGSSLTVEVEEAGEMTLYFKYFDWDFYQGKEHNFTYSVVRMDDLVIETMQGKVELPANTLYTVKFIAHEVGTYKLITGVAGLVIGLSEDTMEYFKGHVELKVLEEGQEFTFYIRYDDPTVHSFVFDWRLDAPFSLNVSEGSYAVDVAPGAIDYKIEFTAPTDGYFLMKVYNKWLTFAKMGEIYDEPVRMETMEVLTHYMTAGEVYTIWLQTVYNYPEATHVYDTLTITNVGEKMSYGKPDAPVHHIYLDLGHDMHTTEFNVPKTGTYRFTLPGCLWYDIDVYNGMSNVPVNTRVYPEDAPYYEMNLNQGERVVIRATGSTVVELTVSPIDYSVIGAYVAPGTEGSRYCFQATTSSYYRIHVTDGELGVIASNGSITWTAADFEVELTKEQTYSFMLRGTGDVKVEITPVQYALELYDGDNTVYMEPNRFYTVSFMYHLRDNNGNIIGEQPMDGNSYIALTWEGNLTVFVNGVEYVRGATIELLNAEVKILVKSNGGTNVKVTVTMIHDANIDVIEGDSDVELQANLTALLAVNRDGDGATASFTAEVGGTYTLTTYDEIVLVYVVNADGTKTQVLIGAGSYSFNMNVGQTIEFFFDTSDDSAASISVVVTPGN